MVATWDQLFAQRAQKMGSSAIRELLKLTENSDIISFAGGLPAPDVFPIDAFREACDRVLHDHGSQALQYGVTEGYTPLREFVIEFIQRIGLELTLDNVLVTSGSQQALDLLGKILIDPGDRILVESPTYLGAILAWKSYGAEFIGVPVDQNGIDTNALEKALSSEPKFIYVLPNFQNPTGVTMSLERRKKLVELADKYNVPIIEDDPYGQLRYEGDHIPPVVVLDSQYRGDCEACYAGNVIYLSTFSKILAPGIRLAWVIAPPKVLKKLVQAKQGADLHTSTFNQFVAYEVSKGGFFEKHIELIRKVYGERRNVMLGSMDAYLPSGVDWTHPAGGLFLWVTLPELLDATEVLQKALQQRVAFVPGAPFFPSGGGQNTLRMNFSNATPESIQEGISRLGRVLIPMIQ